MSYGDIFTVTKIDMPHPRDASLQTDTLLTLVNRELICQCIRRPNGSNCLFLITKKSNHTLSQMEITVMYEEDLRLNSFICKFHCSHHSCRMHCITLSWASIIIIWHIHFHWARAHACAFVYACVRSGSVAFPSHRSFSLMFIYVHFFYISQSVG